MDAKIAGIVTSLSPFSGTVLAKSFPFHNREKRAQEIAQEIATTGGKQEKDYHLLFTHQIDNIIQEKRACVSSQCIIALNINYNHVS